MQNKSLEEILKANPKLIEEIIIKQEIEFSGPLPPPDILKGYNEISPEYAKIIVEMVKKEQQFRHTTISFGQKSALIIGILGLISTTLLGIYGNAWVAGGIGFLSLGSLVGAFLYKQKREEE